MQFYEDDDFLIGKVIDYAREGLERGSSALIIATEEHLHGIARGLESAGIELDELVASGRYVALNAAELLHQLLVDGKPSAAHFKRHVASRVARLTSGGKRLR